MQQDEFTTGAIQPVQCFKEGWEIIKDEYWLMFAIAIVGALIAGASMYILIGPMICGIYIAFLRKIDGGRANFDDLWKGFNYFGKSLPVAIAFVVPIVVWVVVIIVTIYAPIIAGAVGGRGSEGLVVGTLLFALAIDLAVGIAMTIFHAMLIFSFALVVDREMSGIDAIKVSARAAIKNASGVAGLLGVSFVLFVLGYLAFCIGVYFVIPIMTAAYLVAYRRVFPKMENREFEPPPISAYGGG